MKTPRRIPGRLVALGLGSNLGDRLAILRNASNSIAKLEEIELLARSSVYETPPFGGPPQDAYLNAVLLVATERPLVDLMREGLTIERRFGRVRPDPVRWGPRTLDVDVLWCSTETSDAPEVVVPHPRLRERPFALVPLIEVCPEAHDPRDGTRFKSLDAAGVALARVATL